MQSVLTNGPMTAF